VAVAASCLRAAAEGLTGADVDDDEADVGWLLAAEFLHSIRWTLQKK
jgi:hypothetical protein